VVGFVLTAVSLLLIFTRYFNVCVFMEVSIVLIHGQFVRKRATRSFRLEITVQGTPEGRTIQIAAGRGFGPDPPPPHEGFSDGPGTVGVAV